MSDPLASDDAYIVDASDMDQSEQVTADASMTEALETKRSVTFTDASAEYAAAVAAADEEEDEEVPDFSSLPPFASEENKALDRQVRTAEPDTRFGTHLVDDGGTQRNVIATPLTCELERQCA